MELCSLCKDVGRAALEGDLFLSDVAWRGGRGRGVHVDLRADKVSCHAIVPEQNI